MQGGDSDDLIRAPGKLYFMGLMHGHWKLPLEDKMIRVFGENLTQLNVGIAAVVPAEAILKVLDDPRLIEMRRIGDQRLKNNQAPSPDAGPIPRRTQKTRAGIEIGIPTKSQILGDLQKAARKQEKK